MKVKKIIKYPIILTLIGIIIIFAIILYQKNYISYYFNKKPITINTCSDENITFMTYNTRVPVDKNERTWYYRAEFIREDINTIKPDIIAFQEVAEIQYNYYNDIMPMYDNEIIYGNPKAKNEGNALFYRSDRFKLLDHNTFWLSETPDTFSYGWECGYPRTANYIVLQDIITNKNFCVIATHLDNQSVKSRTNGIKLIKEKTQHLNMPIVLMGDFNSFETSEVYSLTTSWLDDSFYITQNVLSSDIKQTYHDFGRLTNYPRIDYIFVSKDSFKVNSYGIYDNLHIKSNKPVYSSDHNPVYINCYIN